MSATSVAAPSSSIPSVGEWRKRARAARREHHHRTLRDTLTDLYTAFWFVLIYGGALYSEVNRHLQTPGAMEGAVERHWLGIAALLAGAGLAWRGLRALGPMLASPAEQYWAVSSPLSRRGWLAGRFTGVVAAGAAAGALAAFTVALLGIRGRGVGLAALTGVVWGAMVASSAVVAQGTDRRRRWPGAVAAVLLGAGGLTALIVIAAHYGGRVVPAPADGIGTAMLAVGAPLACVSAWGGTRTLPRLDRARLGAGAQLAAAVVTAAVWLDVTVLGGVLEVRRWRRVGRVRSRRLLRSVPFVPGRVWGLVQAEVVRTARRPGTLAAWAALGVAQYGTAVAAPSLTGVTRVVLAYFAAGRLMAGLRTVARSGGLRRALGGSETLLRGAHVVVPAVATVVWWLVTIPAGAGDLGSAGFLLAAGVVAAAYRAATRGPLDYDTGMLDTPFGPLPVGLVIQLGRGPDLLGAVILARVLLG